MRRAAMVVAAFAMMAVAAPAAGQSLADVEKAEAAVFEAWNAMPIDFRVALFVEEAPQGFGLYNPRAEALFKAGEPIIVYAEPVGYGWTDNGDGTWGFGFTVDLAIKNKEGGILASQENYQRAEFVSRSRNRELMLTFTLTLDGAPAGDYIVEYLIHDITGDKQATISLPFTIAE